MGWFWRLLDPYGGLAFLPTSVDVGATTLSYTGTYTLVVKGKSRTPALRRLSGSISSRSWTPRPH